MIRIGCQTYTWQMVGDYVGRLDHIIGVAGAAGYQGVEAEMQFVGRLSDPVLMQAHLEAAGVELASLCLVKDWRRDVETESERKEADEIIDYLAVHFPQAILNLCPMPGEDRKDLRERQDNQLTCMNAVAQRAANRGILAAYHPNSPLGSVCRTADDYDRMLNGIDARSLRWIPDVGHIAKGGIDILDLLNTYRSLIAHVHYKDMDAGGQWAVMGEGVIDFPTITRYLVETDYRGWLVVEDESPKAERDPDGVATADGAYMAAMVTAVTT